MAVILNDWYYDVDDRYKMHIECFPFHVFGFQLRPVRSDYDVVVTSYTSKLNQQFKWRLV